MNGVPLARRDKPSFKLSTRFRKFPGIDGNGTSVERRARWFRTSEATLRAAQ